MDYNYIKKTVFDIVDFNQDVEIEFYDCDDVTVEFENKTGDANNAYQGAVADINFTVKTVQANGIDSNGNIIDN